MPKISDYIELSIVIPCYNSEKSLPELNKRLEAVLRHLGVKYEIIYVNDSSQDDTKRVLRNMASNNDAIVVIDLMSNVGQFRSLICGLEHAKGNYIVTMDDDLQHPPEEIVKLYRELVKNADLDAVIGSYKKKKHSLIRNFGSYSAQRIRAMLTDKNNELPITSFRCMTRPLVKAIVSNKTIFPAINLIIFQSTNNIRSIEVDHHLRKYGKSNYSFFELIKVFFAHLLNNTNLPLRVVRVLGLFIFTLGLLFSLYYLPGYFLGRVILSELTVLFLLLNIYTGLLLLSIGVVGEYSFKVLQEVKRYPRYNIREIYRKKE
jgi:polyisoprenyl-phosphate glycosyltransferase